jgi:hypothetical protein
MSRPLLFLGLGAVLGGLFGHFNACRSSACPLTATWWRSALYGAFLGLLYASTSRA